MRQRSLVFERPAPHVLQTVQLVGIQSTLNVGLVFGRVESEEFVRVGFEFFVLILVGFGPQNVRLPLDFVAGTAGRRGVDLRFNIDLEGSYS